MTTKEIANAKYKFYTDNEIDPRTLPMIVNHFISIGAQRAANITDQELEELHGKLEKEAKEAEANHKILLMTPDFQIYLLRACHNLSQLDLTVRNAIIREIL